MNILIPHTWLKEYLDTKATPEEIQRYLSLSGPSVERIEQIEGESVYDIEVTTNRVDSMNVQGIAREAAVILNQVGIKAQFKSADIFSKDALQLIKEQLPLPKIYNNPKLNHRVIFILLRNIKRQPTPQWMVKRLIQIEQNVHDAAIDITNYVTHEIGHPVHAFDYDKLMATGGEIHIVEAKKGEKFQTLDGEKFTTVGGEVVFKNQQNQIIDLPSIKGTANTSIDESTHNILLLAESVRADKVRFASMTHAIRTMAAQLVEKDVDPHLAAPTLLKATQLYQQLCQAEIGSALIDEFPHPRKLKPVKISVSKIEQYLGIKLKASQIKQILQNLECQVETEPKKEQTIFKVTPPTFRPDLTIPADIIEEIARIYGYHQLPSLLMSTAIPTTYPDGVDFNLENQIKHFLTDVGWQEVYTYSLVSEEIAQQSGCDLDQHLHLANPLTKDRVYLRRSLLPSLVEIMTQNPQREQLSVFELANVYEPQGKGKLPQEKLQLAFVSNRDYRHVRGQIEALLAQHFVHNYNFKVDSKIKTELKQTAQIWAQAHDENQLLLGQIGVLKSGLIGAVVEMSQLLKVVRSHPTYQPIPKTMPVMEDLTFTLPTKTTIGSIIETMKNSHQLVSAVTLKDIYQHNYTFQVQYHDLKHNLAATDVEPIRKELVKQVETKYQAQLVGEV